MALKSTKKETPEMKALIDHQQQIKSWLHEVERRILELETSYLEDTPLGNIVKGWDVDGKPNTSINRNIEEKERIFSLSSYHMWMESKSTNDPDSTTQTSSRLANDGNPQKKKSRKSSSRKEEAVDDWDGGDY
jgi:hypothetical protein